jgi:hypothetical protein
MNIKYITLLISILGVIVLYILSLYAQPPVVVLSELPDFEGKIVTTQGTITTYRQTDYGNQIITIRDNNTTATVFASTPLIIRSGDLIQATGSVEQYQDTWEILLNDPQSFQILKIWNETTTPLGEIAQKPISFQDQNLNVTGYIDALYESYFYFTDAKADYTIPVFFKQSYNTSLYKGEKVILTAYFSYDPTQLRYIFTLTEPYHTIQPLYEEPSDA